MNRATAILVPALCALHLLWVSAPVMAALLGVGADPLYAIVADEPRFLVILERQNLPPARAVEE